MFKYTVILFIIVVFNHTKAMSLTLEDIFKKSTQTELQKTDIQSDFQLEWLNLYPVNSPWQSTFRTSIERLWSEESSLTTDRTFNALQLRSSLNQRTPYGVSLGLEYERLFDLPPNFTGFQIEESLSANIFISLYNDFLGQNTKLVNSFNHSSYKSLFLSKAQGQICQKISEAFFAALIAENRYEVNKRSLEQIDDVLKKLRIKSINNRIRRQDELSLKLDHTQLQNETLRSEVLWSEEVLKLASASKLNVDELKELSLNLVTNLESYLSRINLEILKQLETEIRLLKAQKKILEMNQGNDIAIYGGVRSASPANSAFSELQNSVLGLNLNWTLGSESLKANLQRFDAQIAKKEVQKSLLLQQKDSMQALYNKALKQKFELTKKLKDNLTLANELESITYKNLSSGKISFFEFLSLRNQVNQTSIQYTESLASFYRDFLNYAFVRGDYQATCLLF